MSDDTQKVYAVIITAIIVFVLSIIMAIIGIIILPIGLATSPTSYNLETDNIFAHTNCCRFNISGCFLGSCDVNIVSVPIIYNAVFGIANYSELSSEIVYKKSVAFDCAAYITNTNNSITWRTYSYYKSTKNNFQTSVSEGNYALTCYTQWDEGSFVNAKEPVSSTYYSMTKAGAALLGVGVGLALLIGGVALGIFLIIYCKIL